MIYCLAEALLSKFFQGLPLIPNPSLTIRTEEPPKTISTPTTVSNTSPTNKSTSQITLPLAITNGMQHVGNVHFFDKKPAKPKRTDTTTLNLYKDSSSSSFLSQCKEFNEMTRPSDNIITKQDSSDIKIGYLNVQGPLTTDKLSYICWFFQQQSLQILFLSDTQLTIQSSFFMKKEIKARLGVSTKIITTTQCSNTRTVGGQLAICHEVISNHILNVQADDSGLGIYLKLGLRLTSSWLWIIGVYCPSMIAKDTGPKGLWSQYEQFLLARYPINTHIDVNEKLKSTIGKLITKCLESSKDTLVIGGDWNLPTLKLDSWLSDYNLTNYLSKQLPTYYTRIGGKNLTLQTCIDHVLISSALIATEGGINYSTFNQSDHQPIWLGLKLTTPLPQHTLVKHKPIKPIRRVELDRKNPLSVIKLQEHLKNKFPPSSFDIKSMDATALSTLTENICRETVNQVRIGMKKQYKPNKNMHNGWSPTYSVLFRQLVAFQEILRHLSGQHGRHRWRTIHEQLQGITHYITNWLQTADYYAWKTPKQKHEVLHRTGKGPANWLKIVPTREDIRIEILKIKSKIHGRKITEVRRILNQNVATREARRVTGKI